MENNQGMPVVARVTLKNGEYHSVLVPCDSGASAAAAVRDRYRGYIPPMAMSVISPNGAIPIQL